MEDRSVAPTARSGEVHTSCPTMTTNNITTNEETVTEEEKQEMTERYRKSEHNGVH